MLVLLDLLQHQVHSGKERSFETINNFFFVFWIFYQTKILLCRLVAGHFLFTTACFFILLFTFHFLTCILHGFLFGFFYHSPPNLRSAQSCTVFLVCQQCKYLKKHYLLCYFLLLGYSWYSRRCMLIIYSSVHIYFYGLMVEGKGSLSHFHTYI